MAVSIRDVAQRAGVSVGTVSNVLNRPEFVSEESVVKVTSAIEELGYVRNEAARKLRGGISSTVGFVVLDGQNPYFNEVVRGAEDEATRRGIAIIHGNTDNLKERERVYLDLFVEQQVRGVLISPHGDVARELRELRSRGIAAVLVDRFSGDGQLSSVSIDSVVGGRMAVDHLITTGRRRIAFVGGPFDIRQVNDRLAGARVAAENAPVDVQLEVVATSEMTLEEGAAAGAKLLSRPRSEWPDGIFAANDMLAMGLLHSLVVDGRILVPEQMGVIGFDDIPFAKVAAVPLSSIQQPSRMIGRTALRVLLEEAADPDSIPRQTVFQPELVVRRSTDPAR